MNARELREHKECLRYGRTSEDAKEELLNIDEAILQWWAGQAV